MLSFEQARQTILDNITPLGSEQVSLLDGADRILAQDFCATQPMPAWDNSAMDGFAVRYEDCTPGAVLTIADYIPAGTTSDLSVAAGTATRIMTGAGVPAAANAIIPFEDTEECDNTIRISQPVRRGDHIRVRGEDIAQGELILHQGDRLRSAEIALLASFNQTQVSVYRQPSVAIIATGDELVEPGAIPAAGQIIDSNSFALAADLKKIGVKPLLLGIASDTLKSHRAKLELGLTADAIITSAGISAGDCDLVREVLDLLGVKPVFWKVNIKPGRPTAFALNGNKPVFSLPGNPVSTMLTFEELVKPALLKMMGHRVVIQPTFKAIITKDAKRRSDRTRFLRVQVTGEPHNYQVCSAGNQETGILKTMIKANGLAILAPGLDCVKAGTTVNVHWIGDPPCHRD
ncbi:MAG: gephyrin-like molybdotransferase Glp [Thermodesulfobacteriota bacterium]|nr:gephyrin-like molybdotransferase Glp [Thermodesulfobacteriota bacterium]